MYSLIIVDDEHMMRDGLSNLIRWGDMGFTVAAVLEDGQDAIDWLGENHADVVLTDLKMTHASGLDVARFVYDSNLDTKVIIISGYTEFEDARTALNYRVNHYLLKPISVKNIREVFASLREELDLESRNHQARSKEIARQAAMESYLEGQFITDLALGALRNGDAMIRRLRLIGWDRSFLDQPCCIFDLKLKNWQQQQPRLEYGTEEIYTLIWGMLGRIGEPNRCYPVRTSGAMMTGFMAGPFTSDEDARKRTMAILVRVCESVRAVTGVEMSVERIQPFRSMAMLVSGSEKAVTGREAPAMDAQTLRDLWERQQLMMAHVMRNDKESLDSLFDAYIDTLSPLGMRALINSLVDFFANMNQRLREYDSAWSNQELFPYSELLALSDPAHVRNWGKQALSAIMNKAVSDHTLTGHSVIIRARRYIAENYNKDITLTDVADHVFLSPVYLSRLFKEETGVNFSDYLIRMRIQKACDYLHVPNLKVYEVCQKVGYGNVKYFYQLFKRTTGRTPSEYRQHLIMPEEPLS